MGGSEAEASERLRALALAVIEKRLRIARLRAFERMALRAGRHPGNIFGDGDRWREFLGYFRQLRAAGVPPGRAAAGARALLDASRPVLPSDVQAAAADLVPG